MVTTKTPAGADTAKTAAAEGPEAKNPEATAADQNTTASPGEPGRSERWREERGGSALQVLRGAAAETEVATTEGNGTTKIADVVVAKIAGMATREIAGVHSMGRGLARKVGQLRAKVPGQSESPTSTQGVSVEVGQKEAAVDLEIVTWYGESIADVADAVRGNVIDRVEGMTGLRVVEVNIHVNDIHVDTDDDTSGAGGSGGEPRVQ